MKYINLTISTTANPDNVIGEADSGESDGKNLKARVLWLNRPSTYSKKGPILRIRGKAEKKKDKGLEGQFELTAYDADTCSKAVACTFSQK